MNKIKCPKCGEVFTIDEADYASILQQVKNSEFEKELKNREAEIVKNSKISFELEKEKEGKAAERKIAELEATIAEQKNVINNAKTQNQLDIANALKAKDAEIIDLKGKLENAKIDKELAVEKAKAENKDEISNKEKQLLELNSRLKEEENSSKNELLLLKQQHTAELKAKDEQIEFYKDFKAKQSTKQIGESLEQYCHDEFNKIRMTAFPNAYFEKDNDVSKESGSKGDFIFKDFIDGTDNPFVSIMFEMKNENDTTATKHKNEDFFKELDKDRNEKGCEYAILVSLLEADSELYNAGIVDVSYKYPKMYVVRPQCFIPIITLLRNAALNSMQYQKQLVEYRNQNVDVTNFENAVKMVAEKINTDYENASKQYDKVEKMCDDMIKKLQDLKEAYRLGKKWIGSAQNQLPDLDIRKLTKNNPTMKEKFGLDK